jgi:ribonuclease Y
VAPRTVEAVIVQIVDALSGARPGARGEALEEYVSRLKDLEEIAGRNPAVERVFAVRAGREVRVMVDPGAVDDEEAAVIAEKTAKTIAKELDFPGRIKITVIRETRTTAWAD